MNASGPSAIDASARGDSPVQDSSVPESSDQGSSGKNSSVKHRVTRQRVAIASILAQFDDFRTAQQVHEELRSDGTSVGLTTVYRALQAMADAGELDTLRNPDGESAYRRCSTGHHHHLVCQVCGRTVEVEAPEVEQWADNVAAAQGFRQVRHDLEITGTCGVCWESADLGK